MNKFDVFCKIMEVAFAGLPLTGNVGRVSAALALIYENVVRPDGISIAMEINTYQKPTSQMVDDFVAYVMYNGPRPEWLAHADLSL